MDMTDGDGTIVLVAKYPTPGKSKTRLIPALGEAGATKMAQAMLADLLVQLGSAEELVGVRKLLVYAPVSAGADMARLLERYGADNDWDIEPMLDDAPPGEDEGQQLASSDLGAKLAHALASAQAVRPHGPVAFIGMDTPDLPAAVIREGLSVAGRSGGTDAYIAPAHDGGYTLLVVPPGCAASAFAGIEWSSDVTCASQVLFCLLQQEHTQRTHTHIHTYTHTHIHTYTRTLSLPGSRPL